MNKENQKPAREIVVPGELVDSGKLKPGSGTYMVDGQIYASKLGVKSTRSNYVNVIALGGRYIPQPGDTVIGKIIDLRPSKSPGDMSSA